MALPTLPTFLMRYSAPVAALAGVVREAGSGRPGWITLHSEDGEEGTVHVYVGGGGRIEKGPRALCGQHIGHIASHPSVTRAEHHKPGHEPEGARQHPTFTEHPDGAPTRDAQKPPQSAQKRAIHAKVGPSEESARAAKSDAGAALEQARAESKAAARPTQTMPSRPEPKVGQRPQAAGTASWVKSQLEKLEAAKASAATTSERRHIANQITNLKHQEPRPDVTDAPKPARTPADAPQKATSTATPTAEAKPLTARDIRMKVASGEKLNGEERAFVANGYKAPVKAEPATEKPEAEKSGEATHADLDASAAFERHRAALLAEHPDLKAHIDADTSHAHDAERWVNNEARTRLTPEQKAGSSVTRNAQSYPKPQLPDASAAKADDDRKAAEQAEAVKAGTRRMTEAAVARGKVTNDKYRAEVARVQAKQAGGYKAPTPPAAAPKQAEKAQDAPTPTATGTTPAAERTGRERDAKPQMSARDAKTVVQLVAAHSHKTPEAIRKVAANAEGQYAPANLAALKKSKMQPAHPKHIFDEAARQLREHADAQEKSTYAHGASGVYSVQRYKNASGEDRYRVLAHGQVESDNRPTAESAEKSIAIAEQDDAEAKAYRASKEQPTATPAQPMRDRYVAPQASAPQATRREGAGEQAGGATAQGEKERPDRESELDAAYHEGVKKAHAAHGSETRPMDEQIHGMAAMLDKGGAKGVDPMDVYRSYYNHDVINAVEGMTPEKMRNGLETHARKMADSAAAEANRNQQMRDYWRYQSAAAGQGSIEDQAKGMFDQQYRQKFPGKRAGTKHYNEHWDRLHDTAMQFAHQQAADRHDQQAKEVERDANQPYERQARERLQSSADRAEMTAKHLAALKPDSEVVPRIASVARGLRETADKHANAAKDVAAQLRERAEHHRSEAEAYKKRREEKDKGAAVREAATFRLTPPVAPRRRYVAPVATSSIAAR